MNSASAAAQVANVANKASNFANQTVETARFEAIKEPIGFIKIIQFFLAILCFAIACNGSSSLSIVTNCIQQANASQTAFAVFDYSYGYPYDLTSAKYVTSTVCKFGSLRQPDRTTIASQAPNVVSSAQFFVFTGVVSFLYSLAFLIIYVFFKHKYDNIIFLPLSDFAATCLLALFWFAGSIAWAKAIGDIQYYTNPDNLIASLPQSCPSPSSSYCKSYIYPSYGSIVISCILGFANLVLWVGNIWFVLKETSWYKTRKQLQQQQQNITNNPISASNINIQAGGRI